MPEDNNDTINVIIAADFSDELVERIREVSPRLNVRRQFPDVPDVMWETVEVLYTIRTYPDSLDDVPALRWIQMHSAGMGGAINRPVSQSDKITVTSTSGIHSRQMAQYSLMMLLAFHFKLPRMLDFQKQSTWAPGKEDIFAPQPLETQTLGIVGYGSIGRELARLADNLGMTVLASKRNIMQPRENTNDYSIEGTGDPEATIPERLYPSDALATMVRDCDYVVVATPLTEETRHMINKDIFDAMKPTGVIINVGRGAVIDEDAMIDALDKDKIGGAALDVFSTEPLPADNPLWKMQNVIISPHVSGQSTAYHELAADVFIANLKRYVNNEPLMNKLDIKRGY